MISSKKTVFGTKKSLENGDAGKMTNVLFATYHLKQVAEYLWQDSSILTHASSSL